MSTSTPAESALGLRAGQYPFASHVFEHEGGTLHFLDDGSGPPLFMVHGNPTWSFLYRKLVLALRQDFRCIAVDLPGFGLSRPPPGYDYRPESHARHVAALLGHLDLRAGTLVAHNWGGPIGLAAALLLEPRRLERFVLGNTWAWPVNGIWHFECFSKLMGGPLARYLAPRYNIFLNHVVPGAMRRGPLATDVLEAYKAPFRRSADWRGTHVFPACITASRDFLAEVERAVSALSGEQVLLLWPDGDIAFQARELARWRGLLAGPQIVTVDDCGHYLWEEADIEVAGAMQAWLTAR